VTWVWTWLLKNPLSFYCPKLLAESTTNLANVLNGMRGAEVRFYVWVGIAALADVFGRAIDAQEIAPLVAHVSEFRRQDHLAAAAFDGASDQALVFATAVHVRRVEQGHPESERTLDRGDGFLVIARAVEFQHSHAPESKRRNGQSLCSKFSMVHMIPVPMYKGSFNFNHKIRHARAIG